MNIVVIGGGHGMATILRGIKYIDNINLSAIVTVADDGGSTGRIRKYYDIPAMGDIREVMISLATKESLLQQLMDYRFEGSQQVDLLGHNLGNLILTAMTQMCGNFSESIIELSKVLSVKGTVIPSSDQIFTLYAKTVDGKEIKGEANIPFNDDRIEYVYYKEDIKATPLAINAIDNADIIIYGIGSLYTSVLPNIIIDDIKDAINRSKAKKIYFSNVMTQKGETDNYSIEDHVDAIIDHGVSVDCVIVHDDDIPNDLINKYALENSRVISLKDSTHPYMLYKYSLLTFINGYIRHDSNKIRDCIIDILGYK